MPELARSAPTPRDTRWARGRNAAKNHESRASNPMTWAETLGLSAAIIMFFAAIIWVAVGAYKYATHSPGDPAVERRLMAELVPAVEEECRSKSASDDTLRRGKAVVWDVAEDKRSSVYKELPAGSRGYLPDPDNPDPDDPAEATVFLVLEKEETVVGRYSNDALAIRRDLHICVVYWPSQDVAGMHSIGADPPFVCNSSISCERDPDPHAAKWIESLPEP